MFCAVSMAVGSMSIADSTACSASSEYGGLRSRYGSRASGFIEYSTGELDIFPRGTLPGLVSQEGRRVVRDHQRCAVVTVNGAAKFADSVLRIQERLRGKISKRDYHFRFYELELANQIRRARFDFIRLRIAISGRTMLNDIGDKDFLARQIYRFENFCEQCSGRSHEGKSRFVLVRSRALANANDPCLRISLARDTARRRFEERTSLAFLHLRRDFRKRVELADRAGEEL